MPKPCGSPAGLASAETRLRHRLSLTKEDSLNKDNPTARATTLCFNGIDASTGAYLTAPLSPRLLAKLATSESFADEEREELRRKWHRMTELHLAPMAGADPQDLQQAGWGVVFAPNVGNDIKDALRPLLELRRDQAGLYYHDFADERSFRIGDSKNTFLARSKAGPGPVNPKKVPYYLLLVGSPDAIPFQVQYQLDIQYAVGRLHFDTADEYAHYAATVVRTEQGRLRRPKMVTLFGVHNDGDLATQLSADHLITPLAESLDQNENEWRVQRFLGPQCTREALIGLLRRETAPALLITASHGIGFPNGDARQLSQQGALLCDEWPGPLRHTGPIPESFYVAAEHISKSERLDGLIALFFACFAGGTPGVDDFAHLVDGPRARIAPHPFVAALPKALLGRPDGALAAIGHVERAWTYSFLWGHAGRQVEVFESTVKSLLSGSRIGYAMEWFNARYAELSSDLALAVSERRAERPRPETETVSADKELAGLWTANNDARSYVVIGDPAVRLAVG